MLKLPPKLAIGLASLSAAASARSGRRQGSAHHFETLEHRVLLSGSFPGGADNSLAYDAQGYQHIAYYDTAAKNLKYVVQSPQGAWSSPVTIDASSSDVGRQVALAIGPSGQVGVAYFDAAGGHLKFAQLVNNTWQATVIDPKGGPGEYPSLVYNVKGCPVVTYYRPVQHDLRYATQLPVRSSPSRWRITTLAGGTDAYSSLTINPVTGAASVAFQLANGRLMFRNGLKSGGLALPVIVDRSRTPASSLSLTFGPGNLPVVTYYNTATGVLNVAGTDVKGHVFSASKVYLSPNADPHATVLYDSTHGQLDLVYYDASAGGVYVGQSTGPRGPFATSQIQSGGDTNTHAVLQPGTGSITYTAMDAASGALIVNTATSNGPPLSDPAALPNPSAAPSNVAASAISSATIQIRWTDNSDNELGFVVEQSPDGTNVTTLTTTPPNTAVYSDTGLTASTTYYYRVGAVAPGATLVPGSPAPVSVTTKAPTPPAAPSNVAADAISSATIQVGWTDNSDNENGFEVDRSTDGTIFTKLTTTAPNTTTYSDTGLSPTTTYYYRVSALGPLNSVVPGSPNPVSATTLSINADNPQYLLTPQLISRMKAEVTANSPQWQSFKATLDANLSQVNEGNYQGWELPPIGAYALGYEVLKDTDPATASKYADKAIAIMLQGMNGTTDATATGSRRFLARGDGSTTQFSLPNTNIDPSTVIVWTAPIQVQTVVKGPLNGQDAVDYYFNFLNVSNTSDGPANYTEGVDWRYNPDYGRNQIDWSLGSSNQPATGSTYYVTEAASTQGSVVQGWSLNGNTLTFATAPDTNHAIYVEYQYTDAATGLRYQQTNDGRGGYNNILVDSGYTSRNLKYIAIGLDWLWGYQGLSPQVRSQAINLLVRWSDYLNNNPSIYMVNTPASNYGAGTYALRMATAIVLQNRDPADATRLRAAVEAYHDSYVLPLFKAPSNGNGTEQGGFWSEGWNYGPLAAQNILTSDLAYETAGWGSAAPDKAWANDAITALLTEQSTPSSIYDGGDGYAYPLPFPSKSFIGDLSYVATDPALKSYAAWAIRNAAGSDSAWEDLLFQDPAAPAAFWGNNLPLQYLSPGTGLAVARKDWNYNSTWLSFHSGNLTDAAHQDTGQGALDINRGADPLLVNYAAVTGDQTFQNKSTYGNLLLIDDGGAGQQTYRYAEGVWYGNPGVTMPHFDGTSDYAYMQGNYAAAYTLNYGAPGSPNPATELVRDVFYVRGSDYVITYDRATTTQASFLKQLRWHFLNTPTVTGNSWTATNGSSKLFGQTYSDVPLTTTEVPVIYDGTTVQEIQTNNTSPTASVRYVTAMQVASSAIASMDTSTHVESGDGKVEGTQIGSYVVLFGKNGSVSGGTSYQVTAGAGQSLTHYLTDMTPGATYTLTGANQGSVTADAQGVLSFTTTGTGSAQTVTLSAG